MLVIGHRGARGEAPENTLASFLHAQSVGVRHFELDVRLSFDDRPVVIHDARVDRTTGEQGEVADYPATHLAGLDARHNTPGWHVPVGIPTLEEVLITCGDTESWQLEIKSDQPARIRRLVHAMADVITRLNLAAHVTLTSLDPAVLKIARQETPHLMRGYVAEHPEPSPLKTALQLDCALLVSNWRLTDESLVTGAHAEGVPVSVWTVNDLMIAERMRNIGVDSLITDFPTALLAHMGMRERLSVLQRGRE